MLKIKNPDVLHAGVLKLEPSYVGSYLN
jgi:hypothetical protein